MKKLLLILLVLTGCATPKFTPSGGYYGSEPYLYAPGGIKDDYCKMECSLFRVDTKGRKICKECYEKKYE